MPYDVAAAREAIAGLAIQTPVLSAPALAARLRVPVTLKLENLQVTGSFKVRGAANRMLALSDDERHRGVVTCSSGNHGRGVAYVAERLGVPATICVPKWCDPIKLDAIRRHGAETVLHGSTYEEAMSYAVEIQQERGLTFVHPFDDPHVVAGQGTIGLELLEQIPNLDTVVVPLSGGGLIGGIAVALATHSSAIRVVGVSADRAAVMYQSLEAGRPIACEEEEETIANALAGGIGLDNRYTFELVRQHVDDHVLVDENAIRQAMAFAARELKLVVEGGGAVGMAALLMGLVEPRDGPVAVVVSGGNVDFPVLTQIIAEHTTD